MKNETRKSLPLADILIMNQTYRPSMFSVLLQLGDLISENMKISK